MPLYDDLLREFQANQQLEKSGSVMSSSRMGEMERRKSQGPLMSTVMDVLSGAFDPFNVGMGGTHSASIAPRTWKMMSPEAKAMLNTVAEDSPGLFQKILESPTQLLAHVKDIIDPGGKTKGTLSMIRPTVGMSQKAGVDPSLATHAIMSVLQEHAGGISTPVHEAQHMLNFPRIAQTDPTDAATMGSLLNTVLGNHPKGSLQNLTNKYGRLGPALFSARTSTLAQQLPEYLASQPAMEASEKATQLVNKGEGYYKPGETNLEQTGRAMYDEGLAYLRSALSRRKASGYQGGPDPFTPFDLEKLATELNLSGGVEK